MARSRQTWANLVAVGFPSFDEAASGLTEVARMFHARGWAPATAGNYSAVLGRDPLRLAMSVSGADKGGFEPRHFVTVDEHGRRVAGSGRPSDEAAVHLAVVKAREAGAVLHTHSVWATVLSQSARDGEVVLEGLELLKGAFGRDDARARRAGARHRERAGLRAPGRHRDRGARLASGVPRPAVARARALRLG